jgi:hypothetical protein
MAFQLGEIASRHLSGGELADAFEDIDYCDVLALHPARHDRAAIEEHARHVEAQHRHHHAGKALVAARDADERVVTMAAHRQFNGVRDHFAADERGLHALMTHCDAVGHRDGAELARRAAVLPDAFLGGLRLAHQRDVARRGFIPARGNTDEGTMDFLFRQAHRVIVGAVRRALRTFSDVARGQLGFVEFRHGNLGILL